MCLLKAIALPSLSYPYSRNFLSDVLAGRADRALHFPLIRSVIVMVIVMMIMPVMVPRLYSFVNYTNLRRACFFRQSFDPCHRSS
jgi:hypothetical protein